MDKIEYDFYKNPTRSNASQKSEFHIRICNRKVIDITELIQIISNQSTLTPADIQAVLTAFRDEIIFHLQRGKIVKIDGLCRFDISLTTTTGSCTGKENGNSVGLKSVHIHPDKSVVSAIAKNLVPRSKSKGAHSASISEIEVMGKLTTHFAYKRTINTAEFQQLCAMTRYMAGRHINRLLAENRLINIGRSNYPIYMAAPGNFGVSRDL